MRPVLPAGRIALRPPSRAFSTSRSLLAKSTKPPPQKPHILEKPAKFSPPSHGTRLPRKRISRHYGGDLPKQEVEAQARREYPTLMAPEGTWAHWFWTNRLIHVYITTVTLVSLGIATFFINFSLNSPFKDDIPDIKYVLSNPIKFVRGWFSVLLMHYEDSNRRAFESRAKKMNDIVKRQAFQRAHDVGKGPVEKYIGGFVPEEDEGQEPVTEDKVEEVREEPKRKKWFGVF